MCYNIFIVFDYLEWRDYSSRERKSKKKRNKGQKIENGNAIVNDVIASLDEAVERVRVANGMIQGTAQSADDQMKSIDQIRDGIKDISEIVQDNSAMAEETSATSEELAAQAVTLNELVQRFEI